MSLRGSPPVNNSTKTNLNPEPVHHDDDGVKPAPTATLETILQAINSQFARTNAQINGISRKIDSIKTELEGRLNNVIDDISSIKQECAAKFQCYDAVIHALDEKVEVISQEIGNLANRNDLIVSGIPMVKEEDLSAHFEAMWTHVGLRECATPPVDIRRLKSGAKNESTILLQFALRNHRDDFFSNYLRQRDLRLCHLGIDSQRRVYVNENLTVGGRRLKAAALRLKKARKLSSVHSNLGTIYVRGTNDQSPIAIFNEEQLKPFS